MEYRGIGRYSNELSLFFLACLQGHEIHTLNPQFVLRIDSRMPGNSHVRFGERDGETDLSNEARRTISTLRAPDELGAFQ